MERLTTDNPKGNFQMMMNLAYAKDGEVWLRGGKDGDAKLFDVLTKFCSDFCDPPTENFAEAYAEAYTDCLAGYDDVCAIALLFAVATQAAEMRGRLQDYEYTGLTPEDINLMRKCAEEDCGSCDIAHVHDLLAAEKDGRLLIVGVDLANGKDFTAYPRAEAKKALEGRNAEHETY